MTGMARVSRFAQRLAVAWRDMNLPANGGRVLVAVSGGADSLALWLALDELRHAGRLQCALVVAHFDHQLRAASGEDARWVAQQARQRGYECVTGAGAVAQMHGNLEQAARLARYDFLSQAAVQHQATQVLTAHTLDDQAETVLLNLLRGAGPDGLGGMKPMRPLSLSFITQSSSLILARPLLRWARRADTQNYCQTQGIIPLADAMNEDERFARVRVRQQVLPLLLTFNGRFVEALGRTAELLQADTQVLHLQAAELLAQARNEADAVAVKVLREAPPALQSRALRLWLAERRGSLRRLAEVHLRGVARLLEGTQGGRCAELPGGARVERRRGWLLFMNAG
jgi:tRNA(Ile)-lysidine synthase